MRPRLVKQILGKELRDAELRRGCRLRFGRRTPSSSRPLLTGPGPQVCDRLEPALHWATNCHQTTGSTAIPEHRRSLPRKSIDPAERWKTDSSIASTATELIIGHLVRCVISGGAMPAEIAEPDIEILRLPQHWRFSVRTAVLNVIGILRIAMLTGPRGADQQRPREGRQDPPVGIRSGHAPRGTTPPRWARMQSIPPQRRPQYTCVQRLAILQLRAMRGWNKTETARHFSVSDDTIRAWLQRAEDDSLVQTPTPVNRFPDFVRYTVQQIQLFCPSLGKVKIADMLARAGIHIGQTTVGRILKEKHYTAPDPSSDEQPRHVGSSRNIPAIPGTST